MQAGKIAVGSSAAIYIAQGLGLQYEASAGSIALLTLVTTKWETVWLSLYRLATFFIAVILAGLTIRTFESQWIAYGVYIFLIVGISHVLGWQATISVNAVIGTHFLMSRDFGTAFIINEFLLVCIGISVAVLLNLFYDYRNQKNQLILGMRRTENDLQQILREIADYLFNRDIGRNVWEDIIELEGNLQEYISDAYEYQNNTFYSHPGYYIDYFEMRMKQLNILHNLHYEIKKMRNMPSQAQIVAEYILYMAEYVVEFNSPEIQLERLEELFENMKKQPLPKTREEFESRAVLYHVLMDLEEFLTTKKRFVRDLDEKKRRLYWKE